MPRPPIASSVCCEFPSSFIDVHQGNHETSGPPIRKCCLAPPCLAFSTGNALAQGANGLVGAWVLVSADNIGASGERTPTFGPNPRGSLILTSADRYSLHLSRDALPAFAAGSRVRGTPEEIQAVVAGSVAHFGRFAVSDKEINFHVETSTYPNWNGTLQKRTFAVVGDELKYSDAASSAGGRVELVWRRAK
jgi:hypothetical protein